MPTSSLSAYAAWLAKHETKASRRRSLDSATVDGDSPERTESDTTKESTLQEPSTKDLLPHGSVLKESSAPSHPYLQWISRKETKLPAVKIVMATPDSIEEIVERGRAAVAAAQAIGSVASQRSINGSKTTTAQPTDTKRKKRAAEKVDDAMDRAGKKAKTASVGTSPSTLRPVSTSVTREPPLSSARSTSRASSRVAPLPMIDTVRYWQDVDRFSFLA